MEGEMSISPEQAAAETATEIAKYPSVEHWLCDEAFKEAMNNKDAMFAISLIPGTMTTGGHFNPQVGIVGVSSAGYTHEPKPKNIGIGGAPTRATTLPKGPAERKQYPMATGLLFYFPDALAAVANVSWHGNNQHNPGKPLHWDRSKSADEADTAIRHLSESGTLDTDGLRHTAKAAWRILALLQKEIEGEK